MKVTIHRQATRDALRHLVPTAYREAVVEATEPGMSYSLLLFAHAARDVVPSSPVRRALRRLDAPAPDGIVAVGTTFTVEALALLDAAGARVVPLRRSYWTDESAHARQR